jgi:hypothetical protein
MSSKVVLVQNHREPIEHIDGELRLAAFDTGEMGWIYIRPARDRSE